MARFFRFKAEFGWSEVLSLTAAALALFSLIQSSRANSPSVVVTPLQARVFTVCGNGETRYRIIALIPFQMINNGGRATSFLGLRQDKNGSVIMASSAKNKYTPAGAVMVLPREISSVAEDLDMTSEDLESRLSQGKKLFVNYEGSRKYFSADFNRTLPTGEAAIVYLGFMSDSTEKIKQFVVNLRFEFGHGQVVPAQALIEVPEPLEEGQCQSL